MGVKITALPSATTPLAGTEVAAIVQSGTTVQAAMTDIAATATNVRSIATGGTNASSQTSGGVAYFDGTRITTGSALTFSGGNFACTGAIRSSSATAGVGYTTGAGSTQTQTTSRTTGVTINAVCGSITLFSAAGSTSPATFTVSNSAVAATDNIQLAQVSGTDLYDLSVTAVNAGSFNLTFNTKSGTTTEQPVFRYTVIKGVNT